MSLKTSRDKRGKVRRIPKGRRADVRRDEYNELVDLLNERARLLNQLVQDQRVQFERIAQMQAELDLIKAALTRLRA